VSSPLADHGTCRPLRRDAERNRQRILTAAAEVFAARGLDVTLDDIAAHAGVGVGTVYRRFANKDELIDAVFGEQLDEVAAIVSDALEAPDAWTGLTTYLERSLRMQLEDRGFTEIFYGRSGRRLDVARERLAPLTEMVVDRARREGAVREDLERTDLVFVQLALAAMMDATRGAEPELYRRYLALFLDGLRPAREGPSALPVPALSGEQTHAVMTRGG
jgi:AcrR family transcriptional regulator